MQVAIWDLDYYYASERRNLFNPDLMKISSYHKQKGDKVYLIVNQDDPYRYWDIIYICKEKSKTKNAPLCFYSDKRVRWWGDAYRSRVNWRMSDVMLACRSDYLLYPEQNTQLERAEHVRLFNNHAQLLPITQDYRNSFIKKKTIITDPYMWYANKKSIIEALDMLKETKNLYFLYPIWLKKIIDDKDIENKFLELKLTRGAHLEWGKVAWKDLDKCLDFLKRVKEKNPTVSIGAITIPYSEHPEAHWEDRKNAINDFNFIADAIVKGKKQKIRIIISPPAEQLETPYEFIFQSLCRWTASCRYKWSWLDYISMVYGKNLNKIDWNFPSKWSIGFRDLLRNTYQNLPLLSTIWGNKKIHILDIPVEKWKKEFEMGL